MNTYTIVVAGLGFVAGIAVVGAIATIVMKFRSLGNRIEQVFQESTNYAVKLNEELMIEIKKLEKEIENASDSAYRNRDSDKKDIYHDIDVIKRDIDSRFDKMYEKLHRAEMTKSGTSKD